MANFKEDILDAVGDEIRDAIIIVNDDYHVEKKNRKYPKELIRKIIVLTDVIDYFDYEYDDDYGEQECHNIYIWTHKKVFFIRDYDGSTYIESVPKSPRDYHYRTYYKTF